MHHFRDFKLESVSVKMLLLAIKLSVEMNVKLTLKILTKCDY